MSTTKGGLMGTTQKVTGAKVNWSWLEHQGIFLRVIPRAKGTNSADIAILIDGGYSIDQTYQEAKRWSDALGIPLDGEAATTEDGE